MNSFFELFSYSFVIRALIVGTLVSVCAALLGVSLVLKRFSMLGDGLSHVAFGSAAIALAAGVAPLQISIPVVIIAAFLLMRINDNGRIKGDAAIALLSTSALAIGLITASLTTGLNTDINNYMFGSVLAMSRWDVIVSVIAAAVVLMGYALMRNKIFAVTFDSSFASATGVHTGIYSSLISILTAVTVVIGMRIMGALLISSIIIFPSVTAMRVCRSYRAVIITSTVVSVIAFLSGLSLSFILDIPAGASVVVMNLLFFLIFTFAIRPLKKRLKV